jgi:GTP-sensing pleiotropic transcriptional regulator CodY
LWAIIGKKETLQYIKLDKEVCIKISQSKFFIVSKRKKLIGYGLHKCTVIKREFDIWIKAKE